MQRARVATSDIVLAERLRPAHTHWTRLKGLLGTRSLEPGDGLWLRPCRQVHMIGMRYAVDLVFIDEAYRVVRTISGLAPGKFSPKVATAMSVLELPAGTVARARLTEGARIEIEGPAPVRSDDWIDTIGPLLCNLALAALYGVFVAAHFTVARRTGHWATLMPIVVQEALLLTLFLVRRRSVATSPRPLDWALGIVGTFLPMLLRPTEQPGALNWLGAPVQILGVSLAVAGLLFLGRSFALVAANRGITTIGLYRVVRHPMYAAYMLSYLGYLASYPTLINGIVVLATMLLLNARAIVEERFLAQQDARYQAYLGEVGWRFLPHVY